MKIALKFSGVFLLLILSLLIPNLSVNGEDIDALINNAKTRLKAGDAQKSAEMLNHILTTMKAEIRNHPRHAETWYYFSVALNKLGRKSLAEKAFARAKKLKQMQAEKKVEEQNKSEAEKQETAASENSKQPKEPEKTEATELVDSPAGNAYSLKSLKNDEAQSVYRKGAAYLEQGQYQAAADLFLKANEIEPGNLELLEKTSSVLDQIGGSYYQKAQKIYEQLEKHPKAKLTAKQKAAAARANIFSGKPDLNKAQTILAELLKENDKNVEAVILSAQLDTERKRYKPAIEKFNRAIKLDKNSMPAYLGLGNCYLKMENFDKAIEVLSQARSIWPDSFRPLVALGKAYLKNDNLGFALQMFNTAFAINEKDFEVNLGLLEIFARSNDPRASLHLENCEKIVKGDPRVEYWKAVFLELDEKILQAKKAYTWLAMYDDEAGYRSRVRLGQLYSGKGHLTFPGNLLIKNRPHYTANYRALENYKLAFIYYQEVIDKKPDIEEAQEIKIWLDENELKISEAMQFDSLIQSHFRQ
jgi:tetratricopeptide (TPR) repeat protein